MENNRMRGLNNIVIEMIMKTDFQLRSLPSNVSNITIISSSSIDLSSSDDQVQQSPQLSPGRNTNDCKSLHQIIKNLMLWNTQLILQEFINGLKKDRVPIQKKIIQKLKSELEKQKLVLKSVTTNANVIERIKTLIVSESSLFLFSLCQLSKPLTEFLECHLIDAIEECEVYLFQLIIIKIHATEVNLFIFHGQITNIIYESIIQTMCFDEESAYNEVFQKSQDLLKELTHEISDQICKILDEGRNYIEILVNQFRDRAVQNFIMNKYLIIALLAELSRNCYLVIKDLLEFTIFHFAEPEIVEKFMRYIISNYDLLSLRNKRVDSLNQIISSSIKTVKDNKTTIKLTPIKSTEENENTIQSHISVNFNKNSVVEECLLQLSQLLTLKGKPLSVYRICYRDYKYKESEEKKLKKDNETFNPSKDLLNRLETMDNNEFQNNQNEQTSNQTDLDVDLKSYQKGIYIECEDPSLRFIVYMIQEQNNKKRQKFKIIYAPLVSYRWTFEKVYYLTYIVEREPPLENYTYFSKDCKQKSSWGIFPIKYSNVKELIESYWLIDQLEQIQKWSCFSCQERMEKSKLQKQEGQIDSMLGCFLAELYRTNNLEQYLYEFGETAVNNGCMNPLIQQIPLLSELLSMGGFGEKALETHIYNKVPIRKIAPISRIVISTGTSLGTAVSGAIIGQFLIPIPIFGSIVGGLLGGYLGNRGANSILKNYNRKKAQEMKEKLENSQKKPLGYWNYSKNTLDILTINQKFFSENMPKCLKQEQEKDNKWFTLIAFTYLCLIHTAVAKNQYWDEDQIGQINSFRSQWPEFYEYSQRWLLQEKINILPCIENIKIVIETILKNMG